MRVIEDLNDIKEKFKNAVVTLGNFDGVHKGHKQLINRTIQQAKEIDGTSIIITFNPHPLRVLKTKNRPPIITLYDQKKELLCKTGVDVLLSIPFTFEFAGISPFDFLKTILVDKMGVKKIIVGTDYSFGKERKGNVEFLKSHAAQYGYEVIIHDLINTEKDRERISSTRIRNLIKEGQVSEMPNLMGRFYQISGVVEKGRNRGGKLIGFPTANLNLIDELCPKNGVYAVTVEINSNILFGVANIGFSPTFEDHIFTVEVHILDFSDDIYGEHIRVNFIERLRGEKKFSGISELKDQISKDVELALNILNKIR